MEEQQLDPLWKQFVEYKSKHNKTYSSHAEETKRFQAFKGNVAKVHRCWCPWGLHLCGSALVESAEGTVVCRFHDVVLCG